MYENSWEIDKKLRKCEWSIQFLKCYPVRTSLSPTRDCQLMQKLPVSIQWLCQLSLTTDLARRIRTSQLIICDCNNWDLYRNELQCTDLKLQFKEKIYVPQNGPTAYWERTRVKSLHFIFLISGTVLFCYSYGWLRHRSRRKYSNVSALKQNGCRKTDPAISGNVHLVLSKCIKFPDAGTPPGELTALPRRPCSLYNYYVVSGIWASSRRRVRVYKISRRLCVSEWVKFMSHSTHFGDVSFQTADSTTHVKLAAIKNVIIIFITTRAPLWLRWPSNIAYACHFLTIE